MSNILPNPLLKALGADPLFEMSKFLKVHDEGIRDTAVRLNPKKTAPLAFNLDAKVPWSTDAYYLAERPVFTLDPLFHAGVYYSQDASSIFLEHIIATLGLKNKGIKALDLCAAPGGKSTLLNSALGDNSLLVANEIIKTRVPVLLDNLTRWGNANTITTNNDPASFKRLPGYFDLMVVDAPCSGSGMFRKDSDAIDEWSEANVKLCSERQQRILSDALDALKEGGYLIYSTCSYSKEENEDIVDWILAKEEYETIDIQLEPEWGIDHTESVKFQGHGYRFYPHKLKGEGFFVSVFHKTAQQESFTFKKMKPEKNVLPTAILQKWFNTEGEEEFMFFNQQNQFLAFPKRFENDLKILQNVLYLKNAGTAIGEVLKQDLIPHHALSMSNYINKSLQSVDLSLEEAQNYLRKEALHLDVNPADFKGWTLAKYKGINLGWMKILSNRINNYYPKEIRIANL